MKVRISFSIDDLEITVPDETDMEEYLKENAWSLVEQIWNEPASIVPESWEEIDEEEEKK